MTETAANADLKGKAVLHVIISVSMCSISLIYRHSILPSIALEYRLSLSSAISSLPLVEPFPRSLIDGVGPGFLESREHKETERDRRTDDCQLR